jgi:hypothetical protein
MSSIAKNWDKIVIFKCQRQSFCAQSGSIIKKSRNCVLGVPVVTLCTKSDSIAKNSAGLAKGVGRNPFRSQKIS